MGAGKPQRGENPNANLGFSGRAMFPSRRLFDDDGVLTMMV
jgi:hypothetical protein